MRFKPKYLSDLHLLGEILKTFQIKPIKKMKFSFDPYENNSKSLRDVMNTIHSKRVMKTSVARIKIDVKSDKSEPQFDVEFSDGHKIIFKTEFLRPSEIIGKLDIFCKEKDTSQPESDIALTKMSGKPKKKKK